MHTLAQVICRTAEENTVSPTHTQPDIASFCNPHRSRDLWLSWQPDIRSRYTMAQGDRYKRLRTRYEALSTRATAGDSLVPDTAYADFLK